MKQVKSTGDIPPDHTSHDHLNEQKIIPISEEVENRWRTAFEALEMVMKEDGERIVWGLVDGFLLYWNKVRGFFFEK
jgi:nicotinamide/nicotinate riboside kinase